MKNKKLYYPLLVVVLVVSMVVLIVFAINSKNKTKDSSLNQKDAAVTYSDSATNVMQNSVEVNNTNNNENNEETDYVVYYFHNNVRCSTCHKIENYTKEVFERNFKDKYTFKAVNISESENEHFINDYALYTKSVVLVQNQDGQEVKFVNLPKVWDNIRSEDSFKNYLKTEMSNFLK